MALRTRTMLTACRPIIEPLPKGQGSTCGCLISKPSGGGRGHSVVFRAGFHRFSRTSSPKEIAFATREDGACIIEGFYNAGQVRRFNRDIDELLSSIRPGNSETKDEFLKALHGANTKRLANLVNYSPTWRDELLDHDLMHGVCEEALSKQTGDYWLSTAQMIEIGPGNDRQPLHVDGAQWWPFWDMDPVRAPEMMLNFLVAATDTTKQNGATLVIPGSHRISYQGMDLDNSSEPEAWRIEDAVPVELKAGDCLLVGGRIVHAGGANNTTDQRRRVLTATVVSSAFTPEEASCLLVDRGNAAVRALPERVKRFLGFRSVAPVGGVGLWSGVHLGDIKNPLGF